MLYISEAGMQNISFQKIHQLVKKKGFTDSSGGKESACQCRKHKRYGFHHWVGKIPWRREWQPTPVFLPRESPWTKESGRLQFVGSQRVGHNWSNLARTQASMGMKKYTTFSQSYNRPNPWGRKKKKKPQSMVHPSTESLFAHSKLAGIKCTYLLWKEFLELENILFLVTTLPSPDFCSTINKHFSREILILTTLRVLTIVLKKKKSMARNKRILCLWVPTSSTKLHFGFDSECWPSSKVPKKVLEEQWEKAKQKKESRIQQRENVLFVLKENSVTMVLWLKRAILWAGDIKAQGIINMSAILGRVQRLFEIRVVLDPGFVFGVNKFFH